MNNFFFYIHLFSEEELPKKDDDDAHLWLGLWLWLGSLMINKALKSSRLNKQTMSRRNQDHGLFVTWVDKGKTEEKLLDF